MSEQAILLTGGNGFVGAAVRELAARRGVPMRAPSRQELDVDRPETISFEGVRTESVPAEGARIEDVRAEGVRIVIHAAGAAHLFRPTPESEAAMRRTNVEGTRNVVRAARLAGVEHFILVSSVSVYAGEGAYGESKIAAEKAAVDEAGTGMALTILRLATVYGEGDPGNLLRLIRAIDRKRFIWIGRGQNRKTLIHRDDAAAAILAAATAPASVTFDVAAPPPAHATFDVAAPPSVHATFDVAAPPVRMREVVDAIAAALGRSVPRLRVNEPLALFGSRLLATVTFGNSRARALARSIEKWTCDDVYDGSPFATRYGVEPTVSLHEGIAREVAWYRASD